MPSVTLTIKASSADFSDCLLARQNRASGAIETGDVRPQPARPRRLPPAVTPETAGPLATAGHASTSVLASGVTAGGRRRGRAGCGRTSPVSIAPDARFCLARRQSEKSALDALMVSVTLGIGSLHYLEFLTLW